MFALSWKIIWISSFNITNNYTNNILREENIWFSKEIEWNMWMIDFTQSMQRDRIVKQKHQTQSLIFRGMEILIQKHPLFIISSHPYFLNSISFACFVQHENRTQPVLIYTWPSKQSYPKRQAIIFMNFNFNTFVFIDLYFC